MSGVEVIGVISAIISIIDACVKIHSGASKDLKLSETFSIVARRLPILADTLTTCKTYLEPQKSSISPEVWKALEETLESCEEKARNLRTIFEKVITNETDGWDTRYVKVVRRLGKGNKVEELVKAITEDVQLIVNHRAVQTAQPKQHEQLEQIIQEVQSLELSPGNNGDKGTSFINLHGTQNVNSGDGPQFNYENMSGTQHFNLVTRQKPDFRFNRPAGLLLDQATCIDSSLFIGRAGEIQQMHQILKPEKEGKEQRRLVLGGMGGMGKTQLAIAYARTMFDTHYDSVIWINATSEATLKTSYKSIGEQIFDVQGLENLTSEQIVAGIKQWLLDTHNTKWLLIFDNYDEPEAYNLGLYYPHTSHGTVITTTRLPDEVGTEVLMVRAISNIEESLAILETRSKRENLKQDTSARHLAERLAGLPLALVTAGAFLHKDKNTWTFQRYLLEYEKRWNLDPRQRLRLHEYQDRTMYTTWDMSYQRLCKEAPDAAQMLRLLAYFGHQSFWYELFHAGRRDDLPDWLSTVIDDQFDFEELMRILIDYCFIEVQPATEVYGMHACIHDWALSGLNAQVEPWMYWYAFDCAAGSVEPLTFNVMKLPPSARYIPHATRLTHSKFDNIFDQIGEDRTARADQIAQLLHMQGQFATATTLLERNLLRKEQLLGANHTSCLTTILYLGRIYHDQNRPDEAEAMCRRALAGRVAACGEDDILTLEVVDSLALVCATVERWEEAEVLYRRVIAGREVRLGRDHSLTLDTLNGLGLVCVNQGRLYEAETIYLRILAGRKTAQGRDDASALETLMNLAMLYMYRGRLDEAEVLLKQVLAEKELLLGRDHYSTLQAAHNLGIVYANQMKYREAEEMYKRALTGTELILGPKHNLTLVTVQNLAMLYMYARRLTEAEREFHRVITTCQGHREQLLWDQNVRDFTVALSENMRLGRNDQQTTQRVLARLVRHAESWGTEQPVVIFELARALARVKDDKEAAIAFVQGTKVRNELWIHKDSFGCDGCEAGAAIFDGRHVCRVCREIDLCNACMSKYLEGDLRVLGCRGHEFCDVGSTMLALLESPEAMSSLDMDAWCTRLKDKYPLPADG